MVRVQGNRVPAETKKPTFETISRMSSVDRPEVTAKSEAPEVVDRVAAKKVITHQHRNIGMAKFFAKKAPVRMSEGKPIRGNSLRAQALAESGDPKAIAMALIESLNA